MIYGWPEVVVVLSGFVRVELALKLSIGQPRPEVWPSVRSVFYIEVLVVGFSAVI